MANVTVQIPALTTATPLTPNEVYRNGLQIAQEVDRINRKAGKKTNWTAYWRNTYSNNFGGK